MVKCMSHALFKLLESAPMSWERMRGARVLYHVTCAVAFVKNSLRYRAWWSSSSAHSGDVNYDAEGEA